MVSKLDFYKQRMPGQGKELRTLLEFVEVDPYILQQWSKDDIIDYFQKLDAIQTLAKKLEMIAGLDLSSEKSRFEFVRNQLMRHAGGVLRGVDGQTLHQMRPPTATPNNQPWWFLAEYVADRRAKRNKLALKGLLILAAILVTGLVAITVFFKPDPAVIAQAEYYDQAYATLIRERDYAVALSEVELALRMMPNNLDALVLKGIILEFSERTEEAEAIYAHATEVASSPEEVLVRRSRYFREMGLFEEAAILANEGIEINPNSAEAWLVLGQAYEDMLEISKAFEAMQTALALSTAQDNDFLNVMIKLNIEHLSQKSGSRSPGG